MIGDGSCLAITHTGHTNLQTKSITLPLNNVLIVLDITKNLLSVLKLTDAFVFDKIGVYVKDHHNNLLVMLGRKVKGLYQVDSQLTAAYFTQRNKIVAGHLWHQCLAHANSKTLQYLQTQNKIHCNAQFHNVYCSCQMSKSTALPFPLSKSSSNIVLERIHCDVWGPSPIHSFQNFKYYVVFVDNCICYSWLHPMRNKSDFFDIFLIFQKQVENQFDSRIKIFQCDGVGEFTSHKFQSHLHNCGIHQFLSCPHTPQ